MRDDAENRGTLHFRFGQLPGKVLLDEVRIEDVTSGQPIFASDFEKPSEFADSWSIWPPGPQNTVGWVEIVSDASSPSKHSLQVELQAPKQGTWPDFHIYCRPTLQIKKGNRYRVSFFAKADPPRKLIVALYRPGTPFILLGGPPGPFASQVRLAANVGVDLVSFPLPLPWPKGDEKPDWSTVDAVCREVLSANPQALLLPRIGLDPPRWWVDAHPGDVTTWDQPSDNRPVGDVASPLYRDDAAKHLQALIEHLEAAFGDHIAGYHPCGQNTGEWFYEGTWSSPLNGYSTATLAAWRDWLRRKYGSDYRLQQAWNKRDISLQGVEVPTPARRRSAPHGVLRYPGDEQDLIDFAEFQQDMMAECVLHFARTVRQATQEKKLVVFFYGYGFEFGAIRNGAATSGHYGLGKVLKSPDIDVLCSPISYFDRGLGGSAPAMSAAESVMLAGKLWLFEDDTRTFLAKDSHFPGWHDGADTLPQTQELLQRNTAEVAMRHFGTWWMDLGATGWFDDPELWQVMQELAPLEAWMRSRGPAFRSEIAAVLHEKSILHVAYQGDVVTRPLVYEGRRALARCGTPYGQYLLEDVLGGKVPAKMLVFLTAWSLTDQERQSLRTTTAGRLKLWCYAPGFITEKGVSLDSMSELTGFHLREVTETEAWAEPTEIGRQKGLQNGFGVRSKVQPLFGVADAKPHEVLAAYPDGTPAVVLRHLPDGPSLFVGSPALSSELLRLAAREAGIPLFTSVDANVYANGPFIAIHACDDGPLDVSTGRAEPVYDLVARRLIGPGPNVKVPILRGQTVVLVSGDEVWQELQSPPEDSH